MNLESPKINIEKSSQDIFDFLSNVKNFKDLMPENISKFEVLEDDKFLFSLKGMKFEVDGDSFLFGLKGMPEIILKKKEVIPPNKIVLGAAGGKLDFSLVAEINETGDKSSDVQLKFNGDFNPMVAMMIKSPIGKFIETLVTSIPKAI